MFRHTAQYINIHVATVTRSFVIRWTPGFHGRTRREAAVAPQSDSFTNLIRHKSQLSDPTAADQLRVLEPTRSTSDALCNMVLSRLPFSQSP
ncbi:hypothetical protein GW17_00030468 [Ensete ventricosum]|nr:hypothetical protein GW17_00030468 [Ensete ventricosum]